MIAQKVLRADQDGITPVGRGDKRLKIRAAVIKNSRPQWTGIFQTSTSWDQRTAALPVAG